MSSNNKCARIGTSRITKFIINYHCKCELEKYIALTVFHSFYLGKNTQYWYQNTYALLQGFDMNNLIKFGKICL